MTRKDDAGQHASGDWLSSVMVASDISAPLTRADWHMSDVACVVNSRSRRMVDCRLRTRRELDGLVGLLTWLQDAFVRDDQSDERRADFHVEAELSVAFRLEALSTGEQKLGQGNAGAGPAPRDQI